jgi:stage V sporulation protein SpoVS
MVDLTRVPPQALEEGSGQSEGSYDPTFFPSGLPATTVQGAIDYLATQLGVPIKVDGNGPPTGDDDYLGTGGNGSFAVGSRWIDILNDEAYLCVFAGTVPTGGDAKWEQTTTNIASEVVYAPTLPQTATNVQDALDAAFGLGGTDLGNTPDADSVLITSSSGNDTDVPAATGSLAGVMTAADKTKLDGIDSGAQVNVDTNLGNTPDADSVLITSSTGTDTDVPAATGSLAGVMTAADKTKLDGIDSGAQVNVDTNLGNTPDADSVLITSSTGTDTDVPAATGSLAGVMTAADKTKLDGIQAGAQVNGVFGTEYAFNEDLTLSTEAAGVPTAKVTHIIPSASPTGVYRVIAQAIMSSGATNTTVAVEFTVNTVVTEGVVNHRNSVATENEPYNRIFRVSHTQGGGDTTCVLQFYQAAGGGTTELSQARIERERIT